MDPDTTEAHNQLTLNGTVFMYRVGDLPRPLTIRERSAINTRFLRLPTSVASLVCCVLRHCPHLPEARRAEVLLHVLAVLGIRF